jgi:hypothetical protein
MQKRTGMVAMIPARIGKNLKTSPFKVKTSGLLTLHSKILPNLFLIFVL